MPTTKRFPGVAAEAAANVAPEVGSGLAAKAARLGRASVRPAHKSILWGMLAMLAVCEIVGATDAVPSALRLGLAGMLALHFMSPALAGAFLAQCLLRPVRREMLASVAVALVLVAPLYLLLAGEPLAAVSAISAALGLGSIAVLLAATLQERLAASRGIGVSGTATRRAGERGATSPRRERSTASRGERERERERARAKQASGVDPDSSGAETSRAWSMEDAADVLLPALVLPGFVLLTSPMLYLTAALWPRTHDAAMYLADASFGWPLSFEVARLTAKVPLLPLLCLAIYAALPFALMVVHAMRRRAGVFACDALVAFVAVTVVGSCGFFLVPVAGPLYAFPDIFPLLPPDPATLDAAPMLVSPVPRNCMPSLHTGWALLIWWNARPLAAWLRAAAGFFVAVTLLATVALGFHYVVDLVAAFPMTMAVQAWSTRVGDATLRRRAIAAGLAMTLAWMVLVTWGVEALAWTPLLPWTLAALVVGLAWWLEARVSAAACEVGDREAGAAAGSSLSVAMPATGTASSSESPSSAAAAGAARATAAVSSAVTTAAASPSSATASSLGAASSPLSAAVESMPTRALAFGFPAAFGMAALLGHSAAARSADLVLGANAVPTAAAILLVALVVGLVTGGIWAGRASRPLRASAALALALAAWSALLGPIFEALRAAWPTAPGEESGLVFTAMTGVAGHVVLLAPTGLLGGMALPLLVGWWRRVHRDALSIGDVLPADGARAADLLPDVAPGDHASPLHEARTTGFVLGSAAAGAASGALLAAHVVAVPGEALVFATVLAGLAGGAALLFDRMQAAASPRQAIGEASVPVLAAVWSMLALAASLPVLALHDHLLAIVAGDTASAAAWRAFAVLAGIGIGAAFATRRGREHAAGDTTVCLAVLVAAIAAGGAWWPTVPGYFASFAPYVAEFHMAIALADRELVRLLVGVLAMTPPAACIGVLAVHAASADRLSWNGRAQAGVAMSHVHDGVGVAGKSGSGGGSDGAAAVGAAGKSQSSSGSDEAGECDVGAPDAMGMAAAGGLALGAAAIVVTDALLLPALGAASSLRAVASVLAVLAAAGVLLVPTKHRVGAGMSLAAAVLLAIWLLPSSFDAATPTSGDPLRFEPGSFAPGASRTAPPPVLQPSEQRHAALVLSADDHPTQEGRVGEARRFLLTTNERWSLVVIDAPRPWSPREAALHHTETHRLVATRLAPAGLVQAALSLSDLSPPDIVSVVAAMRGAFPSVSVYRADDVAIVVGSAESGTEGARATTGLVLDGVAPDGASEPALLLDPAATDRLLGAFAADVGLPIEVLAASDATLLLERQAPRNALRERAEALDHNLDFLRRFVAAAR